jgi:hypothetical protein
MQQAHRVSALSVLIALSACSVSTTPPPPLEYSVSIDPMFARDQIESVAAAVDAWNKAIPELHLTYAAAPCTAPSAQQACLSPSFDPPDPSDDVVGATTRGADDSSTVKIYVARIRATAYNVDALTQQTATHELGHAMGLQHSATGTLMAADVPNQAPTITPADIAQFWAVRGK